MAAAEHCRAAAAYPALVGNSQLGSAFQVDQFPGADFGAKIQACITQ